MSQYPTLGALVVNYVSAAGIGGALVFQIIVGSAIGSAVIAGTLVFNLMFFLWLVDRSRRRS